MTLEVSVANDNAQHWRNGLIERNAENKKLRQRLGRAQTMLKNIADSHAPSTLTSEIMEFLNKE